MKKWKVVIVETRNKDKLKKITNRNMIEEVFTEIENMGFTVIDKEYFDGYMSDKEKDIICEFYIEEISGFRFALWNTHFNQDDIIEQIKKNGIGWTWADSLEIDPRSDLIFFTQYERDIDKFKPSRSGFVWGIYRDTWEEDNNDGELVRVEQWRLLDGIEAILKYMKKHHFKAVEYSNRQTRYIWEDTISGFSAFIQFVKDWLYELKYKLKKILRYKHLIRVSKKLVKKLKLSYGVVVVRDSSWSPRIEILIRRKEYDKDKVDKDKYKEEQNIIDIFEKKYFMEANVLQFDIDITTDDLSEKEIKEDKDAWKQYVEFIQNIGTDEDERKIVYKNYKGELENEGSSSINNIG